MLHAKRHLSVVLNADFGFWLTSVFVLEGHYDPPELQEHAYMSSVQTGYMIAGYLLRTTGDTVELIHIHTLRMRLAAQRFAISPTS